MKLLHPTRRAFVAGITSASVGFSWNASAQSVGGLLVYCGITMVKPVTELANIFESRASAKVTISQGGSDDLYAALKLSRKGDIYFPGSSSYREQFLPEGLLADVVPVGHNVASLMVAKGNPKRVKPDLAELLRPDLSVVVCDPETGSIGNETKKILDRVGLTKKVIDRAAFLGTDSRNLVQAMKNGQADLTLNWRATAFFPENRNVVDVIDLDVAVTQPAKLELSLLSFSQHPELARNFMKLAASPEGQAVFRKHGFFDAGMTGDY